MRSVFMSLIFLFFTGARYANANENISVCYAKSDENDCIQASARLEVNFSKKSFVLTEHINNIRCWTPDMPRSKAGTIVEIPGMTGRPDYKFVTRDNETIGSVQSDLWTATHTGIIDGFYFFRCSID